VCERRSLSPGCERVEGAAGALAPDEERDFALDPEGKLIRTVVLEIADDRIQSVGPLPKGGDTDLPPRFLESLSAASRYA
jgi:hypothetical protein